ncbi:MAG: hypothetical protein WDZ49_09305, partial [Litorilinea sp.]
MNNHQKVGGVAALIDAATFVFGMVMFFLVLAPVGYDSIDGDLLQNVAFLAENQAIIYMWHLIIYVIFGSFLVILALALHARLQTGAPAMTRTATAFGLIWAGLVIASGMVANIGASIVVELYANDPTQAV